MMNGTEPRNKIPLIRRTRDYRLYDFKGGRYLDLFLDGGRALMGHKHGRAILMMKNSLEKGMAASYPGVWEGRLLKQLGLLYPEIREVSLFFAGRDDKAPAERSKYRLFRPFE
ncbi:MAG TPA: hypothetical protein DCO79_08165, partial [Spirochaeta sp.]|nr:hypothetical protein [Spirochaeta sp.]